MSDKHFLQEQRVNMLGFACHTDSVNSTQLCCCSVKVLVVNVLKIKWAWVSSNETLFMEAEMCILYNFHMF